MHTKTLAAMLTMAALAAGGAASVYAQSQDKSNASANAGSGSANAQSQGKSAAAPGKSAQLYSATPLHTESMASLERAAQRLRESIQSLAQKPAGPEREAAMQAANKALLDTQQAMIDLPAEYRVAGMVVSNQPIVKVNPAQNRTFGDSMQELQRAADQLRESIQAMAQRPAGSDRNAAIKQAHQALYKTQQAMVNVPGMAQSTSTTASGSDESHPASSAGSSGAATGGSGGGGKNK